MKKKSTPIVAYLRVGLHLICLILLTVVSVAMLTLSDILSWSWNAFWIILLGVLFSFLKMKKTDYANQISFVVLHSYYLLWSEPENWLCTVVWVGLVLFISEWRRLVPFVKRAVPGMAMAGLITTPLPTGFFWGASTSSHQVEGNTQNNWTAWEAANAEQRAAGAEERYSKLASWSEYKEEMQNPDNYRSGSGADQFEYYPEDMQIAQELGLTAYRFSIEWSRIEPQEGVFDEGTIAHYRTMIADMQGRGIEPFVTLWHWSVPQWFVNKGEWRQKENNQYAVRYMEKMIDALPEVKYWMTLNEPNVYTGNAYLSGSWPPAKKDPLAYLRAIRNLVLVHREVYAYLHAQPAEAQLGIAQHFGSFQSATKWPQDTVAARVYAWWFNEFIVNAIQDSQDFVGVNYYFQRRIHNGKYQETDAPRSDLGWELHPEGLYTVLKEASRYNKPLYITEHGLADGADTYRAHYIQESVEQIKRAQADGLDVRGYFHWSLVDNFEWAEGFWPRFGLVAVDLTTKKRTIRPSAYEYANIIAESQATEAATVR